MIARGRAEFPFSQSYRKAVATRQQNEEKHAAKIAATRFRDLDHSERLNVALACLLSTGRCSDGTWLLSKPTIDKLRQKDKPLSWLMDRVHKALKKEFGRAIMVLAVLEKNGADFEHLHVITDLTPAEYPQARTALSGKSALGAFPLLHKQFVMRPMPNERWTGYMQKHHETFGRENYYVSRELVQETAKRHEETRRS